MVDRLEGQNSSTVKQAPLKLPNMSLLDLDDSPNFLCSKAHLLDITHWEYTEISIFTSKQEMLDLERWIFKSTPAIWWVAQERSAWYHRAFLVMFSDVGHITDCFSFFAHPPVVE